MAVTDTLPAATVTDTGGASSTHYQFHKLTASFARSGPTPMVGAGTTSWAMARCANCSGVGGGGAAGPAGPAFGTKRT